MSTPALAAGATFGAAMAAIRAGLPQVAAVIILVGLCAVVLLELAEFDRRMAERSREARLLTIALTQRRYLDEASAVLERSAYWPAEGPGDGWHDPEGEELARRKAAAEEVAQLRRGHLAGTMDDPAAPWAPPPPGHRPDLP